MKSYHYIVAILALCVCSVLMLNTGYLFYCSIAGGHGLNSDMYLYYKDITKTQLDAFYLFIAFLSASIIFYTIKYMLRKDARQLLIISLLSALPLVAVFLVGIYLNTKFIGKG